jgi:hypothetical protein
MAILTALGFQAAPWKPSHNASRWYMATNAPPIPRQAAGTRAE